MTEADIRRVLLDTQKLLGKMSEKIEELKRKYTILGSLLSGTGDLVETIFLGYERWENRQAGAKKTATEKLLLPSGTLSINQWMLPDKVLERRLDTLTRNMNEITAIIQPTTINSAAVEEEGPILSSEAKDISSLEPFCHNIRITSGKIYDFAIRSGYTEIAAYAQPLMSTETVVTQSSQADVLLEFKRNEQRSNSHHLSEDEIQEAAIDGAQEKINFLEMALQQQVCENQALNARVAELEATLEAEKSANGRLIRDLEGELSHVNARYHQLLRGQEATLQQITNHCRSRWTNSSNVFPSSDRVEEQPEVLLDGKAIGYDGKF